MRACGRCRLQMVVAGRYVGARTYSGRGHSAYCLCSCSAAPQNQHNKAVNEDSKLDEVNQAMREERLKRREEKLSAEQALVPHGEKKNPYQTDDLGLSMYTSKEQKERAAVDLKAPAALAAAAAKPAPAGALDSWSSAGSEFRLENMGALRRLVPLMRMKKKMLSDDVEEDYDEDEYDESDDEAREWLLKQEQRLFVLRFEAFVESTGIRAQRRAEIEQVFYAMPFTEVPPAFIAGRRVVVKKGKAYVPASSLKMIVAKKFKDVVRSWLAEWPKALTEDLLAASLDVAFQGIHMALADPRVGLFLRQLQEMGMQLVLPMRTSSTEEAGEKLNLGNFEDAPDSLQQSSKLRRETKKHLKHAGRLQLRPFLKDCGFSFEDSVSWWKQELCRDPTIDSGKFDKCHRNYMYDLEHAYGKKGHLQGQNCRGCPKLIGLPGEAVGQDFFANVATGAGLGRSVAASTPAECVA
ncbi:putative DNA primase large subunit [Symbiodinium microadriaticum]|uniref:Putative DNA primase large subunit n=1 Tax=Symbiodinium microadriaticum TaxID=2951 RepID=A0A1Q9DT86_SYMMI|nr:putative DNA primase large subunit [Symbiodinium microadriaticum]